MDSSLPMKIPQHPNGHGFPLSGVFGVLTIVFLVEASATCPRH